MDIGGFSEMRFASIDIGTNTVLMLIADVEKDLFIKRIEDFYQLPRLGRAVSQTGKLDGDAVARTLNVLREYVNVARNYGVERILAFATSAVREAKNGEEFVRLVRDQFGIKVNIIKGQEEAELGYYGAISGANDRLASTLVIDIGGGSTEISYGENGYPLVSKSIKIGAVKLTEIFFPKVPPTGSEIFRAESRVAELLHDFPFEKVTSLQTFATSGTATTLSLIAQGIKDFDLGAVENYVLSYSLVCELYDRLRRMTPEEILSITSAAKGRADVLLAGTLILKQVMSVGHLDCVTVTDRGIRYGFLFRNALKNPDL